MSNTETKQGVFYNTSDYAGFIRRTIIAATDIVSFFLFWIIIGTIWMVMHPEEEYIPRVSFWLILISAYLYLVVFKRLCGTTGYLITGVRIVDLHGNRPSIIRMTGRFMWLFILPFSLILDIIWLTGEETRQTLRDKTVGTYVIKKKAVPAGNGPIEIKVMSLIGLCLRVREVCKNKSTQEQ